MAEDGLTEKATGSFKKTGGFVLKWAPKVFLFTAVTGTLVGVPAAQLLAADPSAGVGEAIKSALTTVFGNAANIDDTFTACVNTAKGLTASLPASIPSVG